MVDRRAGLKSDGYALLYEIDREALSGGAKRGKRLVGKIKRKSRVDRGIVRDGYVMVKEPIRWRHEERKRSGRCSLT